MLVEEALAKLKKWCAYQERSQWEVRRKMFAFKLPQQDADAVIAALIAENFLNEERFAMAFAGGKFRIKHWGKQKIKQELKKHLISDYSINKALLSLDDDGYKSALENLVERKINTSKQNDRRKLYFSVLNYAVSKGYELNEVSKELNKHLDRHDEPGFEE